MREEVFTRTRVTADECFLTGTGAEVGAVVEVDGRGVAEGSRGRSPRLLGRFANSWPCRGPRSTPPPQPSADAKRPCTLSGLWGSRRVYEGHVVSLRVDDVELPRATGQSERS